MTVRGDLVILTNARELTGLSTPLEIRTSRTLTPSAACPNGTHRLSHTSQREREWFCGPTGGVQIAGALGGQVIIARTGSALNEHRKWKEQHSHPHASATLGVSVLQEVTAQVSQDPVAGDGSQQPEQPQETLIYNGIWVKRCLLQELSSQDIPKKPLERWGGKFLEVFG